MQHPVPPLRERARIELRSRALYGPSAEQGQVTVLLALFLAVLAGAAAMATDVGSWYRADQAAQATADAAALAGAQGLNLSTADAAALAEEYAETTGGGERWVRADDCELVADGGAVAKGRDSVLHAALPPW